MGLKMDAQQRRTLAMLLPALTCVSHLLILLSILHVSLSSYAASDGIRIASPYFALYNTFAAAASIAGVIGAARMSPTLVSAYTTFHASTLSFLSLTLLNFFLPLRIDAVLPFIPSLTLDASSMCDELSGAWDEDWLERCYVGVLIVKIGVASVATCMMTAQWWALYTVWNWGVDVRAEEHSHQRRQDPEKAEILVASEPDDKIFL
ncbi:hypothetical protein BDV96DRAFT_664276 [Lophiotrema nucula]|uniref:Uncharacterized protein n=1 Tax=Lophiotrema nucula TaxID=690887 RepID=A0A6A5YZM7_9PLEO|nr:hypothetical protein BDV96DRAFT_664276 [Lophiotrema nucula]